MEALVFEACLILGLALIVAAFVLAVVRSAQHPRRGNSIPRRRRHLPRSDAESSNLEIPWELNYDAFNIPELASSDDFSSTSVARGRSSSRDARSTLSNPSSLRTSSRDDDSPRAYGASMPDLTLAGSPLLADSASYAPNIAFADDDELDGNDGVDDLLPGLIGNSDAFADRDNDEPPLVLASLIEIQNIQEQNRARQEAMRQKPNSPSRPRLLGDTACELGIRYFDSVLAQHMMPRAAQALTNNTNIVIAKNALKATHPSAIFSHGAVAQRIGQNAVCLFEPLETPIADIDNALSQIDDIMQNRTLFVIISNLDECPPENMAHIGPLCRRYDVAKTNIYIEQPDHSFINYIENTRDYVPARIDVDQMPASFFSEIFDYAQDSFDRGDYEAVLRTVDPLIRPLLDRMRQRADFPPLLIAQALNLVGMTQREIGCDDRAVNAFEASLAILQQIEDYNAIKSVKANLGITLALSTPVTLPKIELSIRHLNEVTQLNPRDAEAWLFLANSYIEQFKLTNAKSLLGRALRAYGKSYEIEPAHDVALCMRELERQMGRSPRALVEQPNAAPVKQANAVSSSDAR